MRITGSATVAAAREQTWAALTDPAVLARALPGCQSLTEVADDEFDARVHAGVASIRGLFTGRLALADQRPPNACTLRISGRGGPGTIEATVAVRLADAGSGAGTRVEYDADAQVGGAIAGVGQRVIVGVAKRNAEQFFAAIERELTAAPAPAPAAVADEARATGAPLVFAGPQAGGRAVSPLLAAVAGAAIALAGVLVGRRLGARPLTAPAPRLEDWHA